MDKKWFEKKVKNEEGSQINAGVSASGSNELLCKTPEDYYERNIKAILLHIKKDEFKDCSFIQRICKVGYNQARRTIEYGVNKGVFAEDGISPYEFRVVT